jgi:hypothetical protein
VTIASDSTGVLSVDDNGGALTVDGTVELGATTLAALESLTTITTVTTVSAVTAITNALPSGTNNIGDVDVLSIVPGTGATNLGKVEDAAHTTGDVGVMSLAVRRDADTALAGTDGDYAPLQVNAAGSLKVAITAGAGSGGTSIADGASFTRDTTSITPVGGVVEASAPTVTAGDAVALSLTTAGAVRVAVASGGIAGAVVDSVAGATDEGVLAVAVRDDALATLTPIDGDYTQTRVNARGALWVALDSTAAQTVTLAAGTATNEVVGDAAHDAAAAGNPLLVGGYASAAAPADVSADADAVRAWYLRNGAQATVLTAAGALIGGDATNGIDVDVTRIIPGTTATALGKAEDAAHASGDTGVMALAVRQDTLATLSSATGDYEPLHLDATGRVYANAQVTAQATGGATPGRLVSAASTNGTVVKASAGTLYALVVTNINAAVRYLKVYNSASVTVGTTTPTWTFAIPASATGAGFNVPIPACGIAFGTGICLGMTTGIADNDTGAVAANEIIANYAFV